MELNATTLFLILGILVFLVNVIVEVTKSLYPLNQIRTNYYVTILSIFLTVLAYFIYLSYIAGQFIWYHLIAVIIGGIVVAYLAMFGWDKLIKLWKNSQKGE